MRFTLNPKTAHIFRTLVTAAILLVFCRQANAQLPQTDSTKRDSLRYPIYDRYGDPYSNPGRNTFDLRDTAFINRNVQYDPVTGEYYIIEKIGGRDYRVPVSFTREEFLRNLNIKF